MLRESYLETSYGRVFSMSAGDESHPLIVTIHGWSQRNGWHSWEPLLWPLADAGYFVVSPDMPGWGQSKHEGQSQVNSSSAKQVLVQMMEKQKKDRVILMGKSWGGGVAFQMALDYPDRVSKIIVSAPAYRDITSLKQLTQPVLMAWAEDDPVIPIAYIDKYEAAIPTLKIVRYLEGGHSAAAKNAAEFTPVALAFLSE